MRPATLQPGAIATFMVEDLDDRMKVIEYTIWLSVVDPWTPQWLAQVVRSVPVRDDAATIRAVFDAFKRSGRYEYHPFGTDRFQTLRRSVELGMWDCDCATIGMCAALHTLGYQTGCRIVSSTGEVWEHILPIVWPIRNTPPPADTRLWTPLELTTGPDDTPETAEPGWQIPLEAFTCHRDFRFDLAL